LVDSRCARVCNSFSPLRQFIHNHAQQFNRVQRILFNETPQSSSTGKAQSYSRYEPPLNTFFVASVPNAYVHGITGAVHDADLRLFAPPGTFMSETDVPIGPDMAPEARGNRSTTFPLLATVIQSYGWMYHHWVVETLPKLVLLRDVLPTALGTGAWDASQLGVLTWGQPWEAEWLDVLHIPRSAALTFDPNLGAVAKTLLLPSPVQIITPPAESLHLARDAVLSTLPPAGPRNLIVVTSRAGERSRSVANENDLLYALAAAFPMFTVVAQNRSVRPKEAVALFSRAVAVVGPHGAGLSHTLFCPPGTAVVELMFMRSPPMMFWHMAAALNLRYAMAPQPRSFWCACMM
jgi:Glycosyltransferase 61